MAQALYRKYRSQSLDEIVGQNHIISVLKKSLEANLISHAYLFTGPRGVGKTSVARILASNINQLKSGESCLDIIEIDAASNNSVEDIRDLREKAQIAPASAPKKIYIIDEVHMLSRSAFNALLKTLEEPPEHVVFILATTDPDKLPATVISRTQHFAFRSFPADIIAKQLSLIAEKENIKIEPDVLDIIANQANGGMRDAISLLDQISSLGRSGKKNELITVGLVTDMLGLAPVDAIKDLIKASVDGDFTKIKNLLRDLSYQGIYGATLLDQLLSQILKESQNQPTLINLLSELSKLNKKEAFLDIRLFTMLSLFNPSPSITANKAPSVNISSKSTAQKSQAKQKSVPLIATPAAVIKELPVEKVAPKAVKKSSTPMDIKDFNWEEIINQAKEKQVALGSLVVKCKHELATDENKLILYTINKFNKKKLDDRKYLPLIYEILNDMGLGDLTIETVPSGPPLKSGREKQIANIMGGGEVVEVDI